MLWGVDRWKVFMIVLPRITRGVGGGRRVVVELYVTWRCINPKFTLNIFSLIFYIDFTTFLFNSYQLRYINLAHKICISNFILFRSFALPICKILWKAWFELLVKKCYLIHDKLWSSRLVSFFWSWKLILVKVSGIVVLLKIKMRLLN